MSGSDKEEPEFVTFDEVLNAAEKVHDVVTDHISSICEDISEDKTSITTVELNAVALNLIHGAFSLLLYEQLLGKDLDDTENALARATGLMNLAANRVMLEIPGNVTFDTNDGDHVVH